MYEIAFPMLVGLIAFAARFGAAVEVLARDMSKLIHLVDDDAAVRGTLARLLASGGYAVREYASGAELLAAADDLDGGMVLLDVDMLEPDGFAVTRKLAERAIDVPVVMMTGVADEDQMKLAAVNGANSYTNKPANAEQFLRTVLASTNYWLTIHQSPQHHLRPEDCRR